MHISIISDIVLEGNELYDRTSKSTISNDNEKKDYRINRRGGSITLGHNLINEWEGLFQYRIEDSTTEWIEDKEAIALAVLHHCGVINMVLFQVQRF